eukprot:1158116-Pelagomonas_calceolata.AAC.2
MWVAGGVNARVQQTNPNFQDRDNIQVSLLGEVRRAVCGLASQLWVPGRADEYADGWKIGKEIDWYPFCLDWGTERGFLGVKAVTAEHKRGWEVQCYAVFKPKEKRNAIEGSSDRALSDTNKHAHI